VAIINYDGSVREGTEGTVVSMRESNSYHDSDFYATYFDGKEFVEVCYATTRAGCGQAYSTKIDAPSELKQLLGKKEEADRQAHFDEIEKNTFRVGDVCKVVKGRKIPKETTVTIYSIKEDAYGNTNVYTDFKKNEDDKYSVWTNINNLEKIIN